MSLTITSGDSRSAALTSARPSCTCAITSNSGWSRSAQQFRGFRVIVGEQQAWVMTWHVCGTAPSLWMRGGAQERRRTEAPPEKLLVRDYRKNYWRSNESVSAVTSACYSAISRCSIAYLTSSAVEADAEDLHHLIFVRFDRARGQLEASPRSPSCAVLPDQAQHIALSRRQLRLGLARARTAIRSRTSFVSAGVRYTRPSRAC